MTTKRIFYLGLLAAITLAINGCGTAPKQWHSSVGDKIDSALNSVNPATGEAPIPADISAALLPPLEQLDTLTRVDIPEPRFDISANKTSARAIFMNLVEGTPYSMIIHPKVKGLITLTLKDVTIDEALSTIRQMYGYEYRREGMRFMIMGQGLQTRLFPVSYLNFKRKGVSSTHVSSGELSQNQSNATSNTPGISQQRGINVETSSESDFWLGLSTALEAMVGKEDGRRVVVNPQAGLVVIRALPTELDMVYNFISLTQETVNRQVMLEAKIIEVELNDGFQAGINWAGLKQNIDGYDVMASQIGGGTLLNGNNTSNLSGATGNLDPGAAYSAISSAATSAFGGIFSVAIKGSGFAGFVEMLKTQGNVQVLSSPRVSTVNNQKAVIKVGGDEFFVTGISNTQTSSGGATTISPEVELTPFFSGIALDVTPHIDDKRNIILHIHPTISNVDQRDKNFIVSGESFTLPLAFSNIQESDNVVRAQSGQVIIIGGLMKEGTTEESASVPILGDIPLLGNLFRHKKLTRIKKELVILLKPSVIEHSNDWNQPINESNARTRNLLYRTQYQEGRR